MILCTARFVMRNIHRNLLGICLESFLISRVEMPEQNQVPAMMTFKQFLNAQDDNIDDTEAVQKYKEYKLEFRKTQTSDFFQQHKDEEWCVYSLFCVTHALVLAPMST